MSGKVDLDELRASIRALIELDESEAPVVSCYLSVGARGCALAGRQASEIRRALERGQRALFDTALETITMSLDSKLRPGTRGVAAFSRSGSKPFFMAMQFEVPLEDHVSVAATPSIYGLVALKDTYHRYVVLLATADSARILEVTLGAVTADLWAARPELRDRVGGTSTREHYQDHKRNRTDLLIREQIEVLDQLMAKRGHSHLIVAGSPWLTARIRGALPVRLAAKLVDSVEASATTPMSDVVAATIARFVEREQQESLDAAALLVQEIQRGGLAIAGTAATLTALEIGQVDLLLMADAYEPPPGSRCRDCGAVQANQELPSVCARCGAPDLALVDVKDEMVKLSERHGSTFELVRDSVALMELGGVGCLLRYELPWHQRPRRTSGGGEDTEHTGHPVREEA